MSSIQKTDWKEKFRKTQYNKLAFIGLGAERWIDEHTKAIETEIIGKIIQDLESNPAPGEDIKTVAYWIERKQSQLKAKWLN